MPTVHRSGDALDDAVAQGPPPGPGVSGPASLGTPSAEVDCGIVVVSYDSGDDVLALLATLPAAAVGTTTHTVVVENGSDPAGLAAALAGAPGVDVVDAGGNLGYAGGLNVGLAHCPPARTYLFLNPDLTLAPGSVTALLRTASGPRVGAVVPRMLDADGSPSRSLRREPRLVGALGEALLGDHWAHRPGVLAELVRDPERYEQPHEVDWATGAALLVPATAVAAVGGWDERFFLYSEETDYFRRLRRAGLRALYEPAATVVHRAGGSGTGPDLEALLAVNRVRYHRKHHGPVQAGGCWAVGVLHAGLRWRRPGQRRALHALLRPAVRAALPGPTPR